MSDPHAVKKKIAPGDPTNPRPGYGQVKPHFLVAGIGVIALGYFGYFNFIGGLLFGLLLITWSIDNDYFDFS